MRSTSWLLIVPVGDVVKNGIEESDELKSERVREREKMLLMLIIWELLREKEVYTYRPDDGSSTYSVYVFGVQCIIASHSSVASEEDAV